jgi:hypothetical protein
MVSRLEEGFVTLLDEILDGMVASGDKTVVVEKECLECGVIKPLSDYNKNSGKLDLHENKCRECRSIYKKRHREMKKNSVDNLNRASCEANNDRGVALKEEKFNILYSGMNALYRKVYDATPISEHWNTAQIVGELSRNGIKQPKSSVSSALNSMVKTGIVKEVIPGRFLRTVVEKTDEKVGVVSNNSLDWNWPEMIKAMKISGPTREFANNCVLANINDEVCSLMVDPGYIRGARAEEALQKALQEYKGTPIKLVIYAKEPIVDGPIKERPIDILSDISEKSLGLWGQVVKLSEDFESIMSCMDKLSIDLSNLRMSFIDFKAKSDDSAIRIEDKLIESEEKSKQLVQLKALLKGIAD